MTHHFHQSNFKKFFLSTALSVVLTTGAFAQTANTGIVDNSVVGDSNVNCEQTGTCIGGSANGANINNTETSVTTGDNQNVNSIAPVLYNPSSSGGGNGGSSALVLPTNPLSLQNAALGRSNFGIRAGVNNNPALSVLNGAGSSMGWFLQAGLNIPFGKIPDSYYDKTNARRLDNARERRMDARRDVFGKMASNSTSATPARKSVSGQIISSTNGQGGLNAFDFSTIPSNKLTIPGGLQLMNTIGSPTVQPKVLALEPGQAFSKPLDTGEKIGVLEVGREYPYLGHTKSGWVKVLLPKGVEAWAQTSFEYIKNDYTEVDSLAFQKVPGTKTVARN